MTNKFKEEQKEVKPEKPAKENKVVRSVVSVVSGSFLSQETTIKNLPFVFFLSFLAICYIANGYYADDQVRKVNQLTNEIKELQTQYIVVKDSLVIKSKQTEVAKELAVQQTGIKESVVPPKKIIVAPPGLPQGEE
ncbi:MAG: FtsL-like putative cell division protein [Bacteroidota bacterium]